ncbi:DUF3304 domain-containing protein [Aquitalea aquatica]|uniref:DUF3304 domain-containing protein n=1 Tax=Aquitalea aquatica TaxID=3044273 RepID=A0A838XV69_9NEIS|nr:DUF3304 domain-containing protein [Aquitalea magnusonii]MBA4707030.1 DUF3304 domain-containing protein [Aquitalea magnusonii]
MQWKTVVTTLLLTLSLSACESMARPATIGAGASVVNIMSNATIVHASFNGQGIGGGGGEECCVSLPKKWQPGMMATIEWTKDPNPGQNPGGVKQPPRGKYGSITAEGIKWYEVHEANYTQHSITMPIPPYQKVSSLVLIFLPCDKVYPLIDSTEHSRVLGHLPYGEGRAMEIIRRLGASPTCQH